MNGDIAVLQTLHQLRERDSERLGDQVDVPECEVPLATLNPSHIRPIQTAFGGEAFLRETAILAECSHSLSESDQDVFSLRHGRRACHLS